MKCFDLPPIRRKIVSPPSLLLGEKRATISSCVRIYGGSAIQSGVKEPAGKGGLAVGGG